MRLASIALTTLALAATPAAWADQPNMQAALDSLQAARASLEKATIDKGGHRAKAIKAVNNAIAEVKAGIEFDRTHSGAKENRKK